MPMEQANNELYVWKAFRSLHVSLTLLFVRRETQ